MAIEINILCADKIKQNSSRKYIKKMGRDYLPLRLKHLLKKKRYFGPGSISFMILCCVALLYFLKFYRAFTVAGDWR